MKAIETAYKGYLFRSRLEARWAVFLDKCGVAVWIMKRQKSLTAKLVRLDLKGDNICEI